MCWNASSLFKGKLVEAQTTRLPIHMATMSTVFLHRQQRFYPQSKQMFTTEMILNLDSRNVALPF
jgi:hypothetical protein